MVRACAMRVAWVRANGIAAPARLRRNEPDSALSLDLRDCRDFQAEPLPWLQLPIVRHSLSPLPVGYTTSSFTKQYHWYRLMVNSMGDSPMVAMPEDPNPDSLGVILVWGCRCRCGHKWLPREPERPRVCPKCKSANWDRPKRGQESSTPATPKKDLT